MSQKEELTITDIAKACHEANRVLCEAYGDMSQVLWEEAEDWQKDSAIKGVEFAITNPNAPDSAQHDSWCVDKKAGGWVYGPVKDPEAKTHPCLVPFYQLPLEQQAKDTLFKSVCKALIPLLHRQQNTMDFGTALSALKAGHKVARAEWKGKGMWIALSPGAKALPPEKFWAKPNAEYAADNGSADVAPCITLKTATSEIQMGWNASQQDMLADDWLVV